MNSSKQITNWILGIILVLSYCGVISAAKASDNDIPISKVPSTLEIKQEADYSDGGADTCLKCHDDASEYPAVAIFRSSHAVKGDKRTPFGQLQCESCHGPGGDHLQRRIKKGEKREEMIYFKTGSNVPVAERNAICITCHEKKSKSHWQGSVHQLNDVACHDCHEMHSVDDAIQEVKSKQIEICGKCHQSRKLAATRFSTHPIRYGQTMGCSDCHRQHGSESEHLLAGETVNETCFQCHAEKRGPFLWEHEPASENCVLCHSPHGSNNKAMLTQRPPLLCQNCHSAEGHPTTIQDSSGLSSAMLMGRACSNCHSKVHGSNHPSGNLLQR